MFILGGCNGSGKTTASYKILPEMLDCSEFVNSDEFAKSLSPFCPENASIAAGRYMLLKTRLLFERRADFCIESTLATRSLVKMMNKARQQGYYVTVLYLWLDSPELAMSRILDRVSTGGHYIPEETVRRRYATGLRYLFNDYIPSCDRWILADNSRPPFVIIAEGTRNSLTVKDPALYHKIRQSIVPDEGPDGTSSKDPRPRTALPAVQDGVPAHIERQL